MRATSGNPQLPRFHRRLGARRQPGRAAISLRPLLEHRCPSRTPAGKQVEKHGAARVSRPPDATCCSAAAAWSLAHDAAELDSSEPFAFAVRPDLASARQTLELLQHGQPPQHGATLARASGIASRTATGASANRRSRPPWHNWRRAQPWLQAEPQPAIGLDTRAAAMGWSRPAGWPNCAATAWYAAQRQGQRLFPAAGVVDHWRCATRSRRAWNCARLSSPKTAVFAWRSRSLTLPARSWYLLALYWRGLRPPLFQQNQPVGRRKLAADRATTQDNLKVALQVAQAWYGSGLRRLPSSARISGAGPGASQHRSMRNSAHWRNRYYCQRKAAGCAGSKNCNVTGSAMVQRYGIACHCLRGGDFVYTFFLK